MIRVAIVAVLLVAAATAHAEPLATAERDRLRERLEAVPRGDSRYANARLVLGALELGDERPFEAARALEEALEAGVQPRATALSLLLWSWSRAGDRPRALGTLARWPEAPRALVRRVAGAWLRADAALSAGHDTNVRLESREAVRAGAGVGASWVAASAGLTLRPLHRRDALAVALGLDQRVHVTERSAARLYDVTRATLGASGDGGLAHELVRVHADMWGQETFGDDLAAHLEHAAGADLRLGLHPPGRFEAGIWLGGGLRDLDGAALGDPALDAQDGGRIVAGLHLDAALPFLGAGLQLRSGYHLDMARGPDWDAQGIETHAALGLRAGPLALVIDGEWTYRRFADATPARDEHHVGASIEVAWPLGPITPFARGAGEWNETEAPQQYRRWIVTAGVAATWEAP